MSDTKYTELLKKTACYGVVSFSFLLAKEVGMLSLLIKVEKPLTSKDIADEIHVKHRYAQEILGSLSASGLVSVASNDQGVNVYHLEAAAKEALNNGGDFALPELNYTKILMSRYSAVKSSVESGNWGGVPYDKSFFDMMHDHRMKLSPVSLTLILENVQGLKELLETGIDVIEFGCGTACTLITLADMFPNSRFTATDISSENIQNLTKQCSNIPNIDFDVVDLLNVPETVNKKYDWLYTNDVIHDLPNPVGALKGMKQFMRGSNSICSLVEPGGRGSHVADVGDIFAAFIYTMSTFACIPESFQNGDSAALGLGIGKETFLDICRTAGFEMTVFTMPFNKALYTSKHDL